MYRVINWDFDNEVLAKVDTIEEAKRIQEDKYYFMTGIEKLENGEWISVDGIYEETSKAISEILKCNSKP